MNSHNGYCVGRQAIRNKHGGREIILKANVDIQGKDDGGLDHCGSMEAAEKWVCFIGKAMGLADGLNVENKRKGAL